MNILFINQFFWPDATGTAQILTDVAAGLERQGHKVTVLCGGKGYAAPQSSAPPCSNVIRVWNSRFTRNTMARVLSYFTFLVSAAVAALRIKDADTVVTLTTPPVLSILGWLVKRRTGAAHAIWEMDLYPDVAVQLGVMRAQSILTRSLGRLLDGLRHRADIVIVLGECMREKVLAHGVRPERIRTVENWAHELARPSPRPDCAARLTIVSAGNFGLAHDTGTLKTILLELGGDADMQFVFIGGGKGLEDLESFCKNERIGCASFHPYLPEPEFSQAMARADIGLVTQNNATLGSVVPSKLYGLLSAGIPVLYIGPSRSTSAAVLRDNECGWQFDPGDAAGAIALLRNCRRHREMVHRAGENARELYLKSYTVAAGLARLCAALGTSNPGAILRQAR